MSSPFLSILSLLLMLVLGWSVVAQAQIPAQALQPSQPALGQPPGAPPILSGDPNAPPLPPGEDLRMADPTATHGRFPVTIAGGRVVARCEVSTRHRRVPVNLFIDIDRWRSLAKPLVGSFDEPGADVFVIEEDAGFP